MELRAVDPRKLKVNPNNPRRTKASPEADARLTANIREVGVLQPPVVKPAGKHLEIIYGERRSKCAVAAGLAEIFVLVRDGDDGKDDMRAFGENFGREELGPVDRWRAIEAMAAGGWTDDAVATALNLSPRNIAQLRLLAHICPAMLDQMARGDMPSERELRVIAAADREEQDQVWKKNKPKRGERAHWPSISHALAKVCFYARDAKFGADEAAAFGITWHEDLFAPADEDSRSTTQLDAYLGAQQAWLEANLPEGGSVTGIDEYSRIQLPKGAQERWTSQPAEGDLIAFAVDPRSGKIRQAVYEMPRRAAPDGQGGEAGDAVIGPRPRSDVTQKGRAMIGDLRTEALHQALREQPIEDDQLLGMLVLALGGHNVEVRSGVANRNMADFGIRARIAETLTGGGVLTRDPDTLRQAARGMLVEVLSCRVNHSASGMAARYAGTAIDADTFLPTMATEEFLPCLSRAALERAASAEGVLPGQRAKDTRAAVIARFEGSRFIYPDARFAPTATDLEGRRNPGTLVPGLDGNAENGSEREEADVPRTDPEPVEQDGTVQEDAEDEHPWPVAKAA